jgi:hypothetical protein
VRSIAGNVDPRPMIGLPDLAETNVRGQVRSQRVAGEGSSFPAIDLTKNNKLFYYQFFFFSKVDPCIVILVS